MADETRDPLAPCTDHGCILRTEPSRGMGTNGGCKCLDGDRFELRQHARRLAADRRRLAAELLAARAALAAGDALAAMVRSGRACPEHAAAVPREWCSACAVAGESAAVLVAANAYRATRGAR